MANRADPAMVTFGKAVRAFRMSKGSTQEALAQTLNYSKGWLSNVETGQLRPLRNTVIEFEVALGVTDEALLELYDELSKEKVPGWAKDWWDEEAQATGLRAYEDCLIYGLLQTEDYARAVLCGNEAALQHRMARQARLTSDSPPRVRCVLDELVLYREIGDRDLMRAQLEYLVTGASSLATVQIVPAAANPHQLGAFTIATVDGTDVAYVQSAVQGIVTNDKKDLVRLNDVWESVRSQALPVGMSADFIRRTVEERWT
ncbi:MAG TPA: helix-turn-helix transcriptional regulator [Actinoallomurus sp.]|jgi:transcriptional regulator with XRE-family HTH domain